MKKLYFAFAIFLTARLFAQNFNPTSFTNDGYPFTIGFPSKIEKSIKPSTADTLMMAYSTSNGATYVFSVSKVSSKSFAERTLPGIIKRLETKATKVDLKTNSSVLGNVTTLLNYINDKDTFITIHVFNIDRYIIQVYTMNKSGYFNDSQNNTFFNTLVYQVGGRESNINNTSTSPVVNTTSQNNSAPVINNTQNQSTNVVTNTSNSAWNVNDRAEIYDAKERKWFGCIILKVNTNGTYKIGYDGYSENYDEDVTADRLAKPTSNTTPSFPKYVRAIKGQKITFKGNISSGEIMEDLEWAELSSMACWVGLRNVEFEGKHVAYWFDLPKKSIVKITVTPTSPSTRINIYGYSGFDFVKVPPQVSRCTTCEASFPEWIGQPNLSEPAVPQTIEFNATTIRNRIYFAVAGAKNVLQGDYTITIELQ